MKKKRKILINNIGKKLVWVGIILIILAIFMNFYFFYEDVNAMSESETTLNELKEEISTQKTNKKNKINKDNYIGILSIPAIDKELPIRNEWSYDLLRNTPCVYYGSIEENNLVILGHSYKSHFRYLSKLKENDKIILTDTSNNVYLYNIIKKDVINPFNSDEVIESGYDLVLFSCYDSGTKRVVIYSNKVNN